MLKNIERETVRLHVFLLRDTDFRLVQPHLKQKKSLSTVCNVIISHLITQQPSRPNDLYSPSFSFMAKISTDFRIIMNPASLVSSILFQSLSFELKLTRNRIDSLRNFPKR